MVSLGFIRNHKKKWVLLLILILGFFGYRHFYSSSSSNRTPPASEKDAVAVSTGTIETTIQGVGTVTASSTQTLQFNTNGKITAWNVKAGDKVKKGQILASVDTTDVDNSIKGQQISLESAQISYNKLFSSTKDYQITQLENSIAQTKQNIELAPTQLKNLEMERDQKIADQKTTIANTEANIALAQTKISNLESDLSYTQASSDTTVTQSSSDLAYTVSQAGINAGAELSDAKTFIQAIDSSDLNFDRPYLIPAEFSAKDQSKKEPAITKYQALKAAIDTYSAYISGKTFTSTGEVLLLLPNQDTLSNAVIASCDTLLEALNNSVGSTTLASTSISSLQSTVSSTRSKFSSYLTSSNSTKKSIVSANDPTLVRQNADNTIASKKQSLSEQQTSLATLQANLASQKVALSKLQSDYEIKIAQQKDTNANLELSLKASEQNLVDMKNGPTSDEKAAALNQIAQAKLSLEKTQKQKENYEMIASFDGVVTATNGKVGEISTNSNSSSSSTATSITVEVPSLYKISVLVDQLDVVSVRAGQDVNISFDSYAGKTFTGTVSEVDPTPTTSAGVVSYTVKILFQSETLKLYNNMTATVTIITESKKDALLVPTTAITDSTDKKTVRVWRDGKPVVQEITTGWTLGDKTEVLTGLTLWEKVVGTQFQLSTGSGSSSGFSLFGGNRNKSSSSTTKSSSSSKSSTSGGDMGGPPPGM